MIKRVIGILLLVSLLVSGCVGADGKKYVMASEQELYGLYILGALDGCMVVGLAQMEKAGIEKSDENLWQLSYQCERVVRELFRLRFQNTQKPVPFPIPPRKPFQEGKV